MKRKIKSITMIKDAEKDILVVAVAEDGTAWARWMLKSDAFMDEGDDWHAVPELPEALEPTP